VIQTPKRHYFNDIETKKLTDTTEDYITLKRVEEGKEYHYTSVAAMNDTSDFTGLKFGVLKAGKKIWLEHETILSKDTWYPIEKEIVVTQGDQLIVAFNGITANDICHVSYNGYWFEKPGGK